MAQNHMKHQADQDRTKREFEVEEWVFVRLQPYKQLSLRKKGKKIVSQVFWAIPNYMKD